jgi:nicotinate-nucleotide adenylyltransferase
MKAGIFGGTFNPIHYGHLRAAEEVREKLGMDRVLFIPSGSPPLKTKEIAEAEHRYEMTRLAILKNPFFELSDIEYKRAGRSYTVDTVEELTKADPGIDFHLVLGIDAFLDMPNWRQPERLIEMIDFIVISRPLFRFIDLQESPYLRVEQSSLKDLDNSVTEICMTALKSGKKVFLLRLTPIGISSTELRGLIKRDKSIKYLLPPDIQSYIITNELYKS